MRNNASSSPRGGCVFRRKGSPSVKETPVAVVLIRTLTAQGVFHRFDHQKTVQDGFASQKPCLAPVLVVCGITEQPHGSRSTKQGRQIGLSTNVLTANHAASINPGLIQKSLRYGWIYATASATDDKTCAVCIIAVQFTPVIFGAFSGTTTVSPGLSEASSGSPDHHPELLFFAEITEPSARITKTAFLSATGVIPPAWLRYHFAERPGCALIAVGLKTCPLTVTMLGFLGTTSSSPSRNGISAAVFLQSFTFDVM